MSFDIYLHPLAQMDFESIYAYIETRSPIGAKHWEEAFAEGIEVLRTNPQSANPAAEAFALGRDLRQMIFRTQYGNNYRAVFIVEESQVTILRIRGLGQELLEGDEVPRE